MGYDQWLDRGVDDGFEDGEPITYEQLIQAGWDYVKTGDYFTQMGSESLRDNVNGEEYWKHWKELTGYTKKVENDENKTVTVTYSKK